MPQKIQITEEMWDKVRMEYISSPDASIRGLQKKYGIPYNQIRNRVDKENWVAQRADLREKTTQKSIELVSDHQAEECSKAFMIANKLLDKVAESVELLDAEDRTGIRQLTACIKDLKEIGVFRSEMDRMEQMARIKKLQKDAEEEQTDNTIHVVFEDGIEEYGD